MSIGVTVFIAVFYIVVFLLCLSFFEQVRKIKYTTTDTIVFFCVLFGALLFRLMFSRTIIGHETDINCFRAWSVRLASDGMKNFYSPDYFCDYPPLYMIVLYILGKIRALFEMSYETSFVTLIKLPAMLADLGIGALIYFKGRKTLGNKAATALSFLYLVSPALILNSTLWGQIDAIFALVIGASFLLMYKEKYIWAALLYTVSMLIKPQAFIFAPVYLAVYFFDVNDSTLESPKDILNKLAKIDWKRILICIGIGIATIFVVCLPFTNNFNFMWVIEKYKNTLSSYNYATVNAFNIFALFGYNWKDISSKFLFIPVSVWSYIIILLTVAGSFVFYFMAGVSNKKVKPNKKSSDYSNDYEKSIDKTKIFYMGYLIVATMFTLGAKMHERYIFPALILLALCYIYKNDKRFLYLILAQTCTQFLNASEVLRANLAGNIPVDNAVMRIVSLMNIAVYVYSVYLVFQIYIPLKSKHKISAAQRSKKRATVFEKPFVPGKMVKADYIIMAVITLIYAVVAYVNLGDMTAPQTFYDTVYNAKDAENGTDVSEVVLDMGGTKQVSKVMMYIGIGDSDCDYKLYTSKTGDNYEFYATDKHYPVFTWRKFENSGTVDARYVKITCSKEKMMMGEVGIVDAEGNPISYTTQIKEICDEQEMIPDRATYMNGTYFDEIYHPRTAYEIVHQRGLYENTHPPLGKELIGLGTMIFGMTPFGWRFMGTLTGVLMLIVMYMFLKKLFDNTRLCAIGTFLFAVDFMHFAQTRLATIDSYAVLFIMISSYFLIDYLAIDFNKDPLKKGFIPLLLCGIFFGIGCASKWICIYSPFGIAIILVFVWTRAYAEYINKRIKVDFGKKFGRTIAWCVLCFVVIPVLIYCASYLPEIAFDLQGRTPLQYIIQNQEYMFKYHSGLTSTHPYSSNWYEWIIMKKPLWAYNDSEISGQGLCSTISTFGNPAVWWIGAITMIFTIYIAIKKKSVKALMIIIPYMTQLLPWVMVSRCVFIYHYFACVPFMIMSIVYLMEYMLENWDVSQKVLYGIFYGYCAVALLLFVGFYPVISGYTVSKQYVKDYLKWFDSWVFISG